MGALRSANSKLAQRACDDTGPRSTVTGREQSAYLRSKGNSALTPVSG